MLSLIMLILLFGTIPHQSLALVAFVYMLQAICGMCLGLFVTALCRSREQIIQIGMAIVFPTMILSGVIWPRESMPNSLQVGKENAAF